MVSTIGVMAIAATVLVGGWWLDTDVFRRLRPSHASMVPTTAVSLLAIGAGMLWRLGASRHQVQSGTLLSVIATVVVVLATLDLLAVVLGVDSSVDALISSTLGRDFQQAETPAAATCLLLGAGCLLTMGGSSRLGKGVYVSLATAGLLYALTVMVGYAFDTSALYAVSRFTAMAPDTGVAFLLLFAALLLIRGDAGWVGILLADEVGSEGARRLLPAVVLLPIGLCFLALVLTDVGILTANFRLSLTAILMVVLLTATVVRNADVVNARERDLLRVTEQLTAAISERDHLLSELNHRVKNNLQQMSALLQLEASRVVDPVAKEALKATVRRVTALGSVHRILLSSEVPSWVGAERFLQDVVASIRSTLDAEIGQLSIESEADDVLIDVDRAAVLGLLINELVTRAVQSPPPAGWFGSLRLKFVMGDAGDAVLSILHAGDGEAASGRQRRLDSSASDRIVHGLIGQLDATLVPVQHGGVVGVEIAIPAETQLDSDNR